MALLKSFTMAFVVSLIAISPSKSSDCGWSFSDIEATLNNITGKIESVPPAEAEYIRKEKNISLETDNEARFNIVHSNKFYLPLEVHDSANEISDDLDQAKFFLDLEMKKQSISSLISALLQNGNLKEAVSDYIDFDTGRSPRVLVGEGVFEISRDTTKLAHQIAILAKCQLRLLDG